MAKVDRHTVIKSFWRLNTKDKMIILIAMAIVAGICFALFFYVLSNSGTSMGGIPDSTLTEFGDEQIYRQGSYTDLNVCVQYPMTNYCVYVGGEANAASQTGQSFTYNDKFTIFVMEVDKNMGTDDAIERNLSAVLGISPEGATYKQKKTDKGFINTFEVEYQGGDFQSDKNKCGVLTYRYEGDSKISLVMGVSCRDKNDMSNGKKLLDKVLTTLCNVPSQQTNEETEPADSAVSDNNEAVVVDNTADNQLVTVGAGSYTDIAENSDSKREYSNEKSEHEKRLKEIQQQKDQELFGVRMGNVSYWETNIPITDEYSGKEVAIDFSYKNTEITAREALLTSPYGESYMPSYNNADNDGHVTFFIKSPAEGLWNFKISLNGDFGEYEVNVSERGDYIRTQLSSSEDVMPVPITEGE